MKPKYTGCDPETGLPWDARSIARAEWERLSFKVPVIVVRHPTKEGVG